MKQVYSSLTHRPGSTNAGICAIRIAAKEWISGLILPDFNTGAVVNAIALLPGFNWLELEFTQPSHELEQTEKENKSGPYFEISYTGIINNMDAALQQSLESIKRHQVVAIFTQRNGLKKIIGDTETGMLLKHSNKIVNGSAASEVPVIELYIQSENPSTYYNV